MKTQAHAKFAQKFAKPVHNMEKIIANHVINIFY